MSGICGFSFGRDLVRLNYPVTLHGVGMSLGSADPLDSDYLHRLKALIKRIEPAWVSDHLAWISVGQRYVHDLLPLPYTQEALNNVVERVVRGVERQVIGVSCLVARAGDKQMPSNTGSVDRVKYFLGEFTTGVAPTVV